MKDAILFGVGQARIQRQYFGVRRVMLSQGFVAVADFPLARQEHQHVALVRFMKDLINRFHHRIFDRHRILGIIEKMFRTIANLDRIGSARDFNDGGTIKMFREALRIDGCRGDDDFQVGALGHQLLHIAQQEIDVEAALVRLVDDQRVVMPEAVVVVGFRQQDAIGHDLDEGVVAGLVVEADLVTHRM